MSRNAAIKRRRTTADTVTTTMPRTVHF